MTTRATDRADNPQSRKRNHERANISSQLRPPRDPPKPYKRARYSEQPPRVTSSITHGGGSNTTPTPTTVPRAPLAMRSRITTLHKDSKNSGSIHSHSHSHIQPPMADRRVPSTPSISSSQVEQPHQTPIITSKYVATSPRKCKSPSPPSTS